MPYMNFLTYLFVLNVIKNDGLLPRYNAIYIYYIYPFFTFLFILYNFFFNIHYFKQVLCVTVTELLNYSRF